MIKHMISMTQRERHYRTEFNLGSRTFSVNDIQPVFFSWFQLILFGIADINVTRVVFTISVSHLPS